QTTAGPPADAPDDTITVRSALTTVTITVKNTNNVVQAGVTVYAQKNGTFTQTRTTNGSGVASFSLGSGSYRFAPPGLGTDFFFYSTQAYSCTTPSCTSATITTTIPVVVTLADPGGAPQASLEVFAQDASGNFVNSDTAA